MGEVVPDEHCEAEGDSDAVMVSDTDQDSVAVPDLGVGWSMDADGDSVPTSCVGV